MHVPKKDIVQFIVKEVLQERKATSQKELAERVNHKLKKVDSSYSVSERRARAAALKIPGVRVTTLTKRGRLPKKCPSCSHSLQKVYMKNLKGKKLLVRLSCSRCGYTGKGNRWKPHRYVFELKK
jgi:ribosomal protein S27AE